ncbi:Mur ligase family protein [Rhodocytophaga aerolata]|uniref:Mur ligase family protein n=1 Tax=Rhodocytophaga aerolata TaxID=455078 RepID=A0ABT8RHE6_9BACT|nr:Mur ligase family protein [Rhodocytophaga aerolata]MDO1450593.1 Mur ligase family protein [Rhodocytophaga aerolata]
MNNNQGQRVHFIAIGGSAMHNLAIALHQKGLLITGSDDEIYEPSKSRLQKYGLLPEQMGWYPEKLTTDLDAIILGMHARADNPELQKAKELGIPVYSYPEYIYQQSIDKQRIVIAGSHGKTSITSMILHVLKYYNRKFDYMVGAQIEGFDTMVQLSEDAPIIVIEGDEYLSSPIDRRPKFLHYKHHIGLVSGIAWDHINVYPTFEDYVKQFDLFADSTPKGGILIFDETDDLVTVICRKEREDVMSQEYQAHKHKIENGQTFLVTEFGDIPIGVFGEHNMRNLNGARTVLSKIGISDKQFYEAIKSFRGAANRLEVVGKNKQTVVFKDFAHAPSKLEATTKAVKDQFPDRQLVACMELHTFSSLNKEFLKQYKDTFNTADQSVVYYSPKTLAHKKMPELSEEDVKKAFNNKNLLVFTDNQALQEFLYTQEWANKNLLLMSSGNYNGLDLKQLSSNLLNK